MIPIDWVKSGFTGFSFLHVAVGPGFYDYFTPARPVFIGGTIPEDTGNRNNADSFSTRPV